MRPNSPEVSTAPLNDTTPAQSQETPREPYQPEADTRDIAKREATLHDYRTLEERTLGGPGMGPRQRLNVLGQPTGVNLDEETRRADEQFYRQGYDTRTRHEADVVLDEHERVQEINALYLDERLEAYLERVNTVEQAREERKYGRGRIGCLRRWFSETDIGKASHVLGKATIAGLCVAGATGMPFMTAALGLMANKVGTDAVLETAQYALERPILQQLTTLRRQRHDQVLRAMIIRNEIVNRDNDHELGENARQLNLGGNLHDNLEVLINELDRIETDIIQHESRLALIRTIGKSVRAVASVAWSASAIYNIFNEGLSLGMANLDGLADPTKMIEGFNAGNVAIDVAREHIQNAGVFHDIRLLADGTKFVYEAGEMMASGVAASGGELHALGQYAGEAVVAAAGITAALVAPDAIQARGAYLSNQERVLDNRVLAAPLEEENKPHQAVFTLTGRDASGLASGVTHEMSDLAGLSRGNREMREELEHKKEKFVRGSIMRIPIGLIGNVRNPLPPFVTADATSLLIQVVNWKEDGRNLEYVIINPDASQRQHTNADGIVDAPESQLWREAKADDAIRSGEFVADSYDNFIRQNSPQAQVEQARERMGTPELDKGQTLRATRRFVVQSAMQGQQDVFNNDVVEIVDFNKASARATIRIRNNAGRTSGPFAGVDVREIVNNCVLVDLNKERAENNQAVLNQINTLLKNQSGSFSELGPKQIFYYRDNSAPGNPRRWVGINSVNPDVTGGNINFFIADLDSGTGDIPTGKNLKNAINNSQPPENLSFQDFYTRFNQMNTLGTVYNESMEYANRNF